MEVSIPMIWDIVLVLIIAPLAWWFNQTHNEVKRLNIFLNMTRENYMKRDGHQAELNRVVDHILRLEGKIDKLAEKR